MAHERELPSGAAIAERLGLSFREPSLLECAVTHPSWSAENGGTNYERLEFLGDSVLGFLVADLLYAAYPERAEGELTRMKIELVRGETLARVALALGLDDFVRLGRGAERSGDRRRPSVLEAAFEAVVGAVYLDSGVEGARDFAGRALADRMIEVAGLDRVADAKTLLQEATQACGDGIPVYGIVSETGPHEARQFVAEVSVGGRVRGRGSGRSKQAAEQAAAAMAFDDMPDGV